MLNVCIVIPVYQDFETISVYEKIALGQCLKLLKQHPVCLIGPKQVKWIGYEELFKQHDVAFNVKIFSAYFFSGIGGYSRMLLSPLFFKSFKNYNYILIYQLDAFVFTDELADWCSRGYDYIGAPWFEGFSSNNPDAALMGVGNGGFSLRKVSTHLRVLRSFAYITPPAENWQKRMQHKPRGGKWLREVIGFLLDLTIRNNTYWLMNNCMGFEDQFWCLIAAKRFHWFKLPGVKEAMHFGFEMQPRRMYEMNDRQLPFGCHAWWKYDLAFWKLHIEKSGYQLSAISDQQSAISHQQK